MSSARHSRKIWNHVDELRVDPQLVARLRRNGLRVGAASADAWSAIRAIVDAGGAVVRRDQLSTPRGQPLAIELSTLTDSESIFSYDLQGRLSGKTFSVGQKLLMVDYQLRATLGGRVDLAVTLEIRSDRGVMTWERREGMIRQVPDYDRHVFSETAVSVSLESGEFLVVGLGEQTGNSYLLGSRFLTTVRAGQRYETLYFITPQPYQTRGEMRRNR